MTVFCQNIYIFFANGRERGYRQSVRPPLGPDPAWLEREKFRLPVDCDLEGEGRGHLQTLRHGLGDPRNPS